MSAVDRMNNLNSSDIIYDPLPLYHTAGGMIGSGLSVLNGYTTAIRKKFSASNYWSDCTKYQCTVSFNDISRLNYHLLYSIKNYLSRPMQGHF